MAAILSTTSLTFSNRPRLPPTTAPQRIFRLLCGARDSDSATTTGPDHSETSESENSLLKAAWYGSELLGIATSLFRSPLTAEVPGGDVGLVIEVSSVLDRRAVVDAMKEDFKRSYFVTGNLTLNVYEEDCEFADPAGSFKGLHRFKRNCTNFGSLLEKSNMKLMKWEDHEGHISRIRASDTGGSVASCPSLGDRFSPVLASAILPVKLATGYTEYFYDVESGKVSRKHVRVCRALERFQDGAPEADPET